MKKQYKVYLEGISGHQHTIRTVHADDKKDAKKVCSKVYPNCFVNDVEEIK